MCLLLLLLQRKFRLNPGEEGRNLLLRPMVHFRLRPEPSAHAQSQLQPGTCPQVLLLRPVSTTLVSNFFGRLPRSAPDRSRRTLSPPGRSLRASSPRGRPALWLSLLAACPTRATRFASTRALALAVDPIRPLADLISDLISPGSAARLTCEEEPRVGLVWWAYTVTADALQPVAKGIAPAGSLWRSGGSAASRRGARSERRFFLGQSYDIFKVKSHVSSTPLDHVHVDELAKEATALPTPDDHLRRLSPSWCVLHSALPVTD